MHFLCSNIIMKSKGFPTTPVIDVIISTTLIILTKNSSLLFNSMRTFFFIKYDKKRWYEIKSDCRIAKLFLNNVKNCFCVLCQSYV